MYFHIAWALAEVHKDHKHHFLMENKKISRKSSNTEHVQGVTSCVFFFHYKAVKVSMNSLQSLNIFSSKKSFDFFFNKISHWKSVFLFMWNSSPTAEQHSWHFYTAFQLFRFDFFWGTAKVQLSLTMQPEICNTLSALSVLSLKAGRYGSAQVWTFRGSLARITMILITSMCIRHGWKGRWYWSAGKLSLKEGNLFRMLNTC